MKKLRMAILLLILMGLAVAASPVHAAMSNPDSTPTCEISVWRNNLETGDFTVLIYANIPYASPPTTPVTEAFVWRLIDTDGVTELGSTVGYVYKNNGYGYNVYTMYFSAAEVTALGITWGTGYTVRLSGNPAAFAAPPEYNYTIGAGDYSSMVDADDVEAEMTTFILNLAGDLDSKWGLGASDSLLTDTEVGRVLSIYGETFFRGAIYGIQAMVPRVFSAVVRNIDVDDRAWTDNYSGNLTGQWGGTWINTAQAAGKALFGTSYDLLSVILMLGLSAGLLIANMSLTGDHWNGLIDVACFAVIGARLAMYDFFFLLLVAAVCWFYISAKIWLHFVPS